MTFSPLHKDTQISFDHSEWRPSSFSTFLEELDSLKKATDEAFIFRGQRKIEWLLDSTLARSIKKQRGMQYSDRYTEAELKDHALLCELSSCVINKFEKIDLSPQIQAYGPLGLDPYFEFLRHHQQNPNDPQLNDPQPYGTNVLDFTQNPDVALYFANAKRPPQDEGVLFIVRQTTLGPVLYQGTTPFQNALIRIKKWINECQKDLMDGLPLLIFPDVQMNNQLDPKPARQAAIYLMQTDLRWDCCRIWERLHQKTANQVFLKLILPRYSHSEVQNYLNSQGITSDYLFPETIFDNVFDG